MSCSVPPISASTKKSLSTLWIKFHEKIMEIFSTFISSTSNWMYIQPQPVERIKVSENHSSGIKQYWLMHSKNQLPFGIKNNCVNSSEFDYFSGFEEFQSGQYAMELHIISIIFMFRICSSSSSRSYCLLLILIDALIGFDIVHYFRMQNGRESEGVRGGDWWAWKSEYNPF